jgi:hypothetical protein
VLFKKSVQQIADGLNGSLGSFAELLFLLLLLILLPAGGRNGDAEGIKIKIKIKTLATEPFRHHEIISRS